MKSAGTFDVGEGDSSIVTESASESYGINLSGRPELPGCQTAGWEEGATGGFTLAKAQLLDKKQSSVSQALP